MTKPIIFKNSGIVRDVITGELVPLSDITLKINPDGTVEVLERKDYISTEQLSIYRDRMSANATRTFTTEV